MPPSRKIFAILVALACCLALAFYGVLLGRELSPQRLPVLGQVNAFELTSSEGKLFGLQNLLGKVWVADFVFTTCSGLCPLMTRSMTQLFRSYQLVPDVNYVSISVNPETDTPEVLQAYAKGQKADTRLWHFLTGRREDIQKLAVESFKIGSVEEPIFHSGKFALVDRYGNIRGYYEISEAEELSRLFKDISRLLKERK